LNISQHINDSKHNSLEKLIFAIGIRHVGETTAKVLAKTYQDMDTLANASLEHLLQINDIGETVAISIKDFFHNANNKKLLKTLSELGVNMKYISRIDENNVDKTNQYYQKTFVITGTFDIPRHQIKQLLEQKYDANVIDAPTQSTDFLIIGKNGGSKIQKAKELNIRVIYEEI
jgi:DNA ligase (NAD+)